MTIQLLKRALPFLLTLILGLLLGSLFGASHRPAPEGFRFYRSDFPSDEGSFRYHCPHRRDSYGYAYNYNSPLMIMHRPEAVYTAAARREGVSGVVKLRVTFGSDGVVTDIKPVETLGGGLTDEAVKAARNIEFKPAYVGGRPAEATKYIEYHFDGESPLSDSLMVGFD